MSVNFSRMELPESESEFESAQESEEEPVPFADVLVEEDDPPNYRFRLPIISKTSLIQPKTNSAYNGAIRLLKYWLTVYCLLALVFVLIVPEIRGKLCEKPATDAIMFCLFEAATWIIMTLMLHKSQLPVNYVSLLFLKSFCFYNGALNVGTIKVDSDSITKMFNWLAPEELTESYLDVYPYFVPILAIPVTLLFTNIKIDEYESVALVGTTLTTSMSTALLLTSMGSPRWITKTAWKLGHFRFSILWAYSTALVAFFNTLFLLQRSMNIYFGKLSWNRFYRCVVEILIWLMSVYLVLHFMPVIHPNFNLRTAFDLDISEMVAPVLPSFIKDILKSFSPELEKEPEPDQWTVWKNTVFGFLGQYKLRFWDDDYDWADGEIHKFNFTSNGWVEA